MSLFKFDNIGLKAVSAVVPKNIVKTRDLTQYYSEEDIEKFISVTGVEERRFATDGMCASDLCCKAAYNIFDDESLISRNEIDVLIYVTETPDYVVPATSVILQDKLGLSKDTLVYDMNKACGGGVESLLMASIYLQMPNIKNVLVLVGDTLSKFISPQDNSTGKLMGDAGVAILVTKGEQYEESYFSVRTDGSCLKSVYIPAGGFRNRSTEETREMRKYPDGSVRSLEQLAMSGEDVFSFAIFELPRDIKRLLEFADKTIDDVDKFVFHQANNYMSGYIAKKVKADSSKILHSIQKFGNTAGTSIPLCMVYNRDKINQNELLLMNAIGAGFTYGTIMMNIADCKIFELSEI